MTDQVWVPATATAAYEQSAFVPESSPTGPSEGPTRLQHIAAARKISMLDRRVVLRSIRFSPVLDEALTREDQLALMFPVKTEGVINRLLGIFLRSSGSCDAAQGRR